MWHNKNSFKTQMQGCICFLYLNNNYNFLTDYCSLVEMDVDSQVVTSTTINPHQLRQQSNL